MEKVNPKYDRYLGGILEERILTQSHGLHKLVPQRYFSQPSSLNRAIRYHFAARQTLSEHLVSARDIILTQTSCSVDYTLLLESDLQGSTTRLLKKLSKFSIEFSRPTKIDMS